MSDELKPLPCPFCGSERVTVEAGDGFRWRVAGCCDCGALASEVRCNTFMDDRAAAEAEAKQRAIEEWNRRAPDTQLAAMTAERDAERAKVAVLREVTAELEVTIRVMGLDSEPLARMAENARNALEATK